MKSQQHLRKFTRRYLQQKADRNINNNISISYFKKIQENAVLPHRMKSYLVSFRIDKKCNKAIVTNRSFRQNNGSAGTFYSA